MVEGAAEFQSTLPTRGSDGNHHGGFTAAAISIHAPHEGERPVMQYGIKPPYWISIHAPHEGERRFKVPRLGGMAAFQSTLPTRGSDVAAAVGRELDVFISIHAPHEGERPILSMIIASAKAYFNPRSPRGGATAY